MKYLLPLFLLAGCATATPQPWESQLHRTRLLQIVQLEQRIEALERENQELHRELAFVGPIQP